MRKCFKNYIEHFKSIFGTTERIIFFLNSNLLLKDSFSNHLVYIDSIIMLCLLFSNNKFVLL
jgi:hypothetical protein